MIVKIPLAKDFDFAKIIRYRPFFFFHKDAPVRSFLFKGKPIGIEFFQDSTFLVMKTDKQISENDIKEFTRRIKYCFGTGEDFIDFYNIAKNDEILSKHYGAIYGNRLLSAFSDFEACVSIICSQNTSFRQYKSILTKIIDVYGKGSYFPEPEHILKHPEKLKSCGVGYRDKYILDTCLTFRFKKSIDRESLAKIKGFGRYSQDIFRLFQERDYNYFYVDRLIKRIFRSEYRAELANDFEVRNFAEKKFGKYAGLSEVYLQKFLCDNR